MTLEDRVRGKEEGPAKFTIHKGQLVQSTVEEVEKLLAKNPTHPKAVDIARAIRRLPPETLVAHERTDLLAILENAKVNVSYTPLGNNERLAVKELVTGDITAEPREEPEASFLEMEEETGSDS